MKILFTLIEFFTLEVNVWPWSLPVDVDDSDDMSLLSLLVLVVLATIAFGLVDING